LLTVADITRQVTLPAYYVPVRKERKMKPLQCHAAAGSFYHLAGMPLTGCACNGLACFAARADNPARWARACQQRSSIYCLGKCYAAPSDADHDTSPHIAVHSRHSVLLDNVSTGGVRGLAEYQKRGGGTARLAALAMPPTDVVRMIDVAQLRGRGGAGFPAGRKWQAMAAQHAPRKYLASMQTKAILVHSQIAFCWRAIHSA
jgi:formate dehydrogenase iron-sulfur subunit